MTPTIVSPVVFLAPAIVHYDVVRACVYVILYNTTMIHIPAKMRISKGHHMFEVLRRRCNREKPQRTLPSSTPAFFAFTRHTKMVELNLEQILETTDTIVQELLATGEFG